MRYTLRSIGNQISNTTLGKRDRGGYAKSAFAYSPQGAWEETVASYLLNYLTLVDILRTGFGVAALVITTRSLGEGGCDKLISSPDDVM
jgi:hypothetical protein